MPPTRTAPILLLIASLAVPGSATGQRPPITAAASADPAPGLASISAAHLRAHLAFLADDMLEGRAPGTRGGDLAAHYVATRFERIGLDAVAGSYFQHVPLAAWTPIRDSVFAEFGAGSRRTSLRYPADIVPWTEAAAPAADVAAEVVFAGYGIVAPEYGWDDYAGADVRGKVVLVLSGEPRAPADRPRLFDGEQLTIHGRWNTKLEQAGRRGAAATLLIHSPDAAGYDWNVVESSWTGERLSLRDDPGPVARIPVLGWVRQEAARALLAAGNRSLAELSRRAGSGSFTAQPTAVRLRVRIAGTRRIFDAPNVVGLLPGSDPQRRGEAVVFMAHYDHIGIGAPLGDDSIYNGAYDNASGVAALLEIAEAFAALQRAPARSILFLATTAEEAGLLGARHYVRRPIVPLSLTAAAINIDGANLWGETRDVIALGGNRSTLGEVVRARARDLDLFVAPEPAPHKGLFFRTDQAPFARAGVPAIAIQHGTDFVGRPPGWGEAFLARWEALHYHQPTDEIGLAGDLAGAVQQARLAFLVGWTVATGERPRIYADATDAR